MIDIDQIRDNSRRAEVKNNLARRAVAETAVEELFEADKKWRQAVEELDALRAKKNEVSQKIAGADEQEKKSLIAAMKDAGSRLETLEEQVEALTTSRDRLWRSLPNLVDSEVQAGGEKDAAVIAQSDIQPRTDKVRDYLSLLPRSIDLTSAAQVSGSRFVYIKNKLARLEFALVSFVMDLLSDKGGFQAVIPPVLIKEEPMRGMGYLEHSGDEVYRTQDDLYLVGTSEQSLGPMYMNSILSADQLPLRFAAFSSCFRREAGSHGKDVKGILRLHQFDKVEMFSFVSPEASESEHQNLLSMQRAIMDRLALPYRVVRLAAGDLGVPSAKTYDIETWIPSEGQYRETHSTSNTTDYQSRRLNIRLRRDDGSVEKVHMLNGTAIALSRILIALIENHQQPDGTIAIPAALHPYLPYQVIEPEA